MRFCQRRAIIAVEEGFKEYAITKQDFLGNEEKLNRVLTLIPDENILDITMWQLADNYHKCIVTQHVM